MQTLKLVINYDFNFLTLIDIKLNDFKHKMLKHLLEFILIEIV